MPRRQQPHSGHSHPRHLRAVGGTVGAPSRLERALEADSWRAVALAEWAQRHGGVTAYETLCPHDLPPDEPFDWSGIAAADREVVAAVLAALDTFTAEPVMEYRREYGTILRRLLALAARHPAHPLRRRTSPQRLAAALTWIAFAGNFELGRRRGKCTAQLLWWMFDVGNCAPLARSIAQALGMLEEQPGAPKANRWLVRLRHPGLMRGYRRRWEIEDRDALLDQIEAEQAERAANAVVQITADGFTLRAREAELAMCVPMSSPQGEPLVGIALGHDPVEPDEAFSLSLADARHLLESLERALHAHEHRSS